MTVAVQIGSLKTYKMQQYITARLNGQDISFDSSGKFITSRAAKDRDGIWFMAVLDCDEDAIVDVHVITIVTGLGHDEDRCFKGAYKVTPELSVQEVKPKGVGHASYPLLRGRVEEVSFVTETMEREREIDNMLDAVD